MYVIQIEYRENDEISTVDIVCSDMKRVIDFIKETEKGSEVISVLINKKEEEYFDGK